MYFWTKKSYFNCFLIHLLKLSNLAWLIERSNQLITHIVKLKSCQNGLIPILISKFNLISYNN